MKALNEFLKESVKYKVSPKTGIPYNSFLSFSKDLKHIVKADVNVNTSWNMITTNSNDYHGVVVYITDGKYIHSFAMLQDGQNFYTMLDDEKARECAEVEFTHILIEPYDEDGRVRKDSEIYEIVGNFDNLTEFAYEFGRMYNDVIDYQDSNNCDYITAFKEIVPKYKRFLKPTNEKNIRI